MGNGHFVVGGNYYYVWETTTYTGAFSAVKKGNKRIGGSHFISFGGER